MSTIIMGVRDVFPLVNSDDIVVVGMVKGTVRVGDAVYATNCGEDEGELFLTTIVGIEVGPSKPATEATDCNVALRIEKGATFKMKKGTVLFSRECTQKEVQDTYISTLGDVFVSHQNLDISDKDFEMLSMSDCAEIWRLFVWFKNNVVKNDSEEAKQADKAKVDRLGEQLCKKILDADAIYCIYNKDTGEPHMFSKTVDRGDGNYMCTAPQITIGSKVYADDMSKKLSEDKYEIRRIDNGPDKKGIYNFLGSTFYLNGACEVTVEYSNVGIGAEMLVQKPDYSNIPPQNIPVTNPDLMRWMLLIGQMGRPEGKDAELIYNLYYKFMAMEMVKAKFIIPMQPQGEMPKGDKDGKVVLNKEVNLKLATMGGKNDKPAVRMYTDWKRLRMEYGNEWSGMVQPISGMIEVFDCAINVTEFPAAGCYISKEMFESMKNISEKN